MKISSFRYIVPQSFKAIRGSGRITIAAVATITIALFLCAFFALLLNNVELNAAAMEDDMRVVCYLDGTVDTQVEQNRIAEQLREIAGVDEVSFISKEEGIESISSRFGDVDLVETLGGSNPLPDSFSITALSAGYIPGIAEACEQISGISVVRYGEGTVEKISTLTDTLREVSVVIMLLLAVAAITLIAMSVRLTIVSRSKEILIMKWVGATNGFIRWPFFLEGLMLGLLGAIIAIGLVLLSYNAAYDYLSGAVSFMQLLPLSEIWLNITVFTVVAGLVLGAIGSLLPLASAKNV